MLDIKKIIREELGSDWDWVPSELTISELRKGMKVIPICSNDILIDDTVYVVDNVRVSDKFGVCVEFSKGVAPIYPFGPHRKDFRPKLQICEHVANHYNCTFIEHI